MGHSEGMSETVTSTAGERSWPRGAPTHVPFTDQPIPPQDVTMPPWPGTTETAGGVTLHVRRTPGQPDATVVYLHGLGGSATNWTDLAAALAPRASGVALDLPGFGFSEPAPEFAFTLDAHVDTLASFLVGLADRPVHLLGNSMGGAIALLLAARRPELVRTLTLVSPAMPDRRPDPRRLSDPRMALAYLPIIGRPVRRALAATGPRQRAQQVIELCFADPASFPERRLDELAEEHGQRDRLPWAARALARNTLELLRSWFARGSASLWAVAPTVSVPTLVVAGSDDRVISARTAARTAKLMPGARLLVLPKTGHVAQMERPTTVAKAVLGMWEQVDAGRW